MTPARQAEDVADGASTYTPAPGHRYHVGDRVRIKRLFPPGHRRTPFYIRGKEGVIERICGAGKADFRELEAGEDLLEDRGTES